MSLVCADLPQDNVRELNRVWTKGPVEVFESNRCAVFVRNNEFYFRRIATDLESEIRADNMDRNREYLCTVFEVDRDDPTVVDKLRTRFVEVHGQKLARTIDDCVVQHKGKTLMIVKFPAGVVRHMLASSGGGLLQTCIHGSRSALAQLPTLVKFNKVPAEEDATRTMFVTQYNDGQYLAAQNIHCDILREVLARPHLGITLSPFMAWDS